MPFAQDVPYLCLYIWVPNADAEVSIPCDDAELKFISQPINQVGNTTYGATGTISR